MDNVVVGIDLGTTNSCVAAVRDGRPKIIEDERGYNILPSCVAYKSAGKFVVGHGAKAMVLTSPAQTVYAVKRVIGRKYSSPEVQEALKRLTYDLYEGEHDSVVMRLGEVDLTPEEVSSVVLKAIKDVAERSLDCEVTQAIVTVPAYFNHAQRQATLESVELADLECVRLINEPTAAALAFGFKKDLDKKIAVYDLGGGTFDISVLEIGGGVYETLGTSGNSYLGGEDFDYRIVDHLADEFQQQHGVDLRGDKMSLQRLKDAAERAKCELSFVDRTPLLVPRIWENLNLEVTLTRDVVEDLVDDLVKETIRITSESLGEANVAIDELDEIILVGGQTRMPKIQEAIRVFFGMSPCKGVHPEEVVAMGAAVQAFSLEEEGGGDLLLDVTPFSLGIDTAGGFFSTVVDRNTTIPATQQRTFTTVRDNQQTVQITVRQGESEIANENEFLGEFSLGGVRQAPRMEPRIDVLFRIDANGILHVTAMDQDTGEEQTVRIKDYQERAVGEAGATTDVQLAQDLTTAATAGAASAGAAAADESGILGRLKGLFGRPEAPGAPATRAGTEVADREAPAAGTEVTERESAAAAATPTTTEVTDREASAAAATPATTEVADREAAAPSTEVADRDAEPLAELGVGDFDPYDEPGSEDDLGDALEEVGGDDAKAVTPRAASPRSATADPAKPGPSTPPEPLPAAPAAAADHAMVPVDEPARSSAARGGDPADPFAVAERPQSDPFGVGAAGDDPFAVGGDTAPASDDPFADPSVVHSRRTRKVDTPAAVDTLPADFDPASDPEAARVLKKKPARLKIRYKKATTFVSEPRTNLDRGGAFIKTPKPLAIGRRCNFELTVPDADDPIRLRGVVVWSTRGMEAPPEGADVGMGIRYDADDREGLDAAREAVARLGG